LSQRSHRRSRRLPLLSPCPRRRAPVDAVAVRPAAAAGCSLLSLCPLPLTPSVMCAVAPLCRPCGGVPCVWSPPPPPPPPPPRAPPRPPPPPPPPDLPLPPPRRPYPHLRPPRWRSRLPRLPRSRPVLAPRGPRAPRLRRVRGAARAPGVPRRPAATTRRPRRHRRLQKRRRRHEWRRRRRRPQPAPPCARCADGPSPRQDGVQLLCRCRHLPRPRRRGRPCRDRTRGGEQCVMAVAAAASRLLPRRGPVGPAAGPEKGGDKPPPHSPSCVRHAHGVRLRAGRAVAAAGARGDPPYGHRRGWVWGEGASPPRVAMLRVRQGGSGGRGGAGGHACD